MSYTGTVLWWGRFDPDYSRNRVLRQAFRQLGWDVTDFRPVISRTGDLEARLQNVAKPDFVWVPSFRQRDVEAASSWATRMDVPLVFDPLISAYDKQVFERGLLKEGSSRAKRLLCWEQELFQLADILIADTSAHATYFHSDFSVSEEKISVVPVGAEEGLFRSQDFVDSDGIVEVLFYGTFIDLQGPLVIVEAASRCRADNVAWTMLGAGPLLAECQTLANRLQLTNLRFEPWVPYADLPKRIGRADILLGAFGASRKASSVIPNKVYQSLACGRPVITRSSIAYPPNLTSDACPGMIQIAPDDPDQLVDAVLSLVASEQLRSECRDSARHIFEEFYSCEAIAVALKAVVQRLTT